MAKTLPRATADDPKVAKARCELFKCCLVHLNDCFEQGLWIESVALEESFLTDRLSSYLIASGNSEICEKDSQGVFINLGDVVKAILNYKTFLKEVIQGLQSGRYQLTDKEKTAIGNAAIFKWWNDQRNRVIHGMAKVDPARIETTWEEKYTRAEMTARVGKKLIRVVDNVCRKLKRQT